MSSSIDAIRIASALSPIQTPKPAGVASSGSAEFKNLLTESIQKVEAYRAEATAKVDRFLAGEGEELHNVALATQQAELSFELFLQTRNKVVQAYQEVMRMQV